MLPLKRKRAHVSYTEPDDELFEDDTDYGSTRALNSHQIGVADETFNCGPRKRRSKRETVLKNAVEVVKQAPSKPFPFMDLPSEIRNSIYELALIEPEGLALVSKFKSCRRTARRGLVYQNKSDESYYNAPEDCINPKEQWKSLVPSLLTVSKQIHSEAVGYLYKQRIIVQDTDVLHTFLAAIGQSKRLLLSDLVVKGWGRGRGIHKAMNVAAMSLLATCTNLQNLHFDCLLGYYRMPKQLATQLFRDGHFFFEAFGVAHGRKDAAVDIVQLRDCNFDVEFYESGFHTQELQDRKRLFQRTLRKLLLT